MIIMVVAGMNLRRDLPPQIGSEGLETRQISSSMYASQESAWTGLSCAKWCAYRVRGCGYYMTACSRVNADMSDTHALFV